MSTITLYNDDCFNIFPLIADHSIDMVCCDLPYGITANKWDCELPLDKLWVEYERILKKKGNIILFANGLFAHKLALSNERLYRYDLIWKKSKCGSALTAKYMPLKKHEVIIVFGESASYYEPQLIEGKPYKRNYTPNKANNMQFGIKGAEIDNIGTRHPSSILDYPQKWRRQDQVHPTQKPVELLEWLVKSYCPIDGIVLDNCMGSGTCGVACKHLNRDFIGIEKEKDYFNIAEQRINDTKPM